MMMNETSATALTRKRKFKGAVVSVKSAKSAVVRVARKKLHKRYKKQMRWSKRYLIHDEKDELCLGDEVEFIESRPYSKRKRFCLLRVLVPSNAAVIEAQAQLPSDAAVDAVAPIDARKRKAVKKA